MEYEGCKLKQRVYIGIICDKVKRYQFTKEELRKGNDGFIE